jgi:signal transduction histidine kinase/HAMP domain-containing protein
MAAKHSIRSIIFLSFVAMGLMTGIVGGYSLFVLSAARTFVADTYDRTLMAVSYARAASLDFERIEKEQLRRSFVDTEEQAAIDVKINQLGKSFTDDLAVVDARSTAADERVLIIEIRQLIDHWVALRKNLSRAEELVAVAEKIVSRLDMLIELTADNSFIVRRQAISQMDRFRNISFAVTALALLLSIAITLILGRRITRPLASAAAVANRIASGELDTPIPAGGRDETGTLLHSMTVMQENIRVMVEREKAQSRSAQNRLVEALETSHEAIALVDADARIVIANTQLTKFFPTLSLRLRQDTSFAEAFDRFHELVASSMPSSDDNALSDSNSYGDLLSAGGEFRLADGRWLRVSRSPTQEGGFFLVISDFSEIKEREQHLHEARLAAEAASAAKSTFLANMSHELRTPLNAIIGFSEIMAGETFGKLGNPKYLEYAKDIEQSGSHLLAVINNVLDLTKSQAGKLQVRADAVDLAEITESCVKIIRQQCAQVGLGLSVNIPELPLTMWGDAAQLRQILLNLMSNAMKFTEPGGAIKVSAEAAAADEVMLRVADTGIGMSPDDIGVALEPFGQVDNRLARRYEGTGLGLPLTKALVELYGGSLTIDSVVGEGTEITVILQRGTPPALLGGGSADESAIAFGEV